MSRGSTLDLSKSDQIPSLEVAVPMLELPKRRFGRSCVENVAHWELLEKRSSVQAVGWRLHTFMETVHVQLSDERGYVGVLEVLAANVSP